VSVRRVGHQLDQGARFRFGDVERPEVAARPAADLRELDEGAESSEGRRVPFDLDRALEEFPGAFRRGAIAPELIPGLKIELERTSVENAPGPEARVLRRGQLHLQRADDRARDTRSCTSKTSSMVPLYFSAHSGASVSASTNWAVIRKALPALRTVPVSR
jgi:hypothetical protein